MNLFLSQYINKVDKKVKMSKDGVIKYQILTFCFLNDVQISASDLNCLTELARIGDCELTSFCKTVSDKQIFKSPQSARNAITKAEKKDLVKKIGNETPECISEGKDIYKRTLAECFIDGESLSSFLVRSGYAFAYRKYSKKFIEDEEFARANKLGLWSMKFQYPWDFRKKS